LIPEVCVAAPTATPRRYLMCRPTYFDVVYAINPWMHPDSPTDTDLAVTQWENLRAIYLDLGHQVELVEPSQELPDMVFAANGGLVIDGRAMGPKFRNQQRAGEEARYLKWFQENADEAVAPTHVNEGEGDFLVVGGQILGGTGFRSDPASFAEVQEFFGLPVVQLELVDPRFYHLDTALTVLNRETVAYLPAAFSPGSRKVLESMFPNAIVASEEDAEWLGLNAVSDGYNVVLPEQAAGLIDTLRERGFNPVPINLSELLKSGGGPKCCTLELRDKGGRR
jgi:N-dimethylarginine dimethylaminohydrolase